MAYLIPKATKKERKLVAGITVLDAAVILGTSVPALALTESFGLFYRFAFTLLTLITALVMTRPSRDNPGRRRFTSYLYTLRRNRKVYKSI